MSKLTRAVRGQPCALRFFPGCDPETVVPCHLPWKARNGVGLKVPDLFTVPGCARCHDVLDRRGSEWRQIPDDVREQRMRIAFFEWLEHLVDDGLVAVK